MPKTCTSTKMAVMRQCSHRRIWDHYFLFFFLFCLFLTLFLSRFYHHQHQGSHREDFHWQQENNICFDQIDSPRPLFNQANPGLSGVYTQVTFVFLYTRPAVRGMKGQSRQTEPDCFVPHFRCWWINGETDSHVCLCCYAARSPPAQSPVGFAVVAPRLLFVPLVCQSHIKTTSRETWV